MKKYRIYTYDHGVWSLENYNKRVETQVIFSEVYGEVVECQKCGADHLFKHLEIHHIDKNSKNNHPLNLIKLCLRCHILAHEGDDVQKLMKSRYKFLTGEKL